MTRSFVRVLIIFAAGLLGIGRDGTTIAVAKPAGKHKKAQSSDGASNKAGNACGCYQNGAGACFCAKKSKCGCPGECEPRGCEEKRQKEIEREVTAETKKAAEADKKQRKASADAERASERSDADKPPASARKP